MGLSIRSVAVVGAGVSGVGAAIHLRRAGLDVTVYERTARAGGIWVYDERVAKDTAFPSTLPSTGDSPEFEARYTARSQRQDSPMSEDQHKEDDHQRYREGLLTAFAPPGPCYITLKNNVSTPEMEMSCQAWKSGTEDFVLHNVLADYIQDAAVANGAMESISFNTRVNKIEKQGSKWRLEIAQIRKDVDGYSIVDSERYFDAIVIATGHYHACNVPDIPGLSLLKQKFPSRIRHSKLYRKPEEFRDQNVLLIGSGVSSMDIARNLDGIAQSVFQSSRGGLYDVPSHLLPENAARVGEVGNFAVDDHGELVEGGAIPMTVHLRSGQRLCNIHHVIVCTGYHVSLPFMRQYHADGVSSEDADDFVLVTDGLQTHNLHKDIWYISDPTMAFIGVPYHTATFTLFEFQSMALAAVFSGKVPLPSITAMREEYLERIENKGAGRTFHSLRKPGEEIAYVNDLVRMVNGEDGRFDNMTGHTDKWLKAYARRRERMIRLFLTVRDPSLDARVIALMNGC